jgi:hypothetical protein
VPRDGFVVPEGKNMRRSIREFGAYAKENWGLSVRFWEATNLNFAAAGVLLTIPIAWLLAVGWEVVFSNFALRLAVDFSSVFLLVMLLIITPFRMWLAQRGRAEAAEAALLRSSAAAEPISLLELAQVAECDFGWDLFSKSAASGWQAWDLKSGLEHAASRGIVEFDGKTFRLYSSPPPDNPFLRRDELFEEIQRAEWVNQKLQISIPGSNFGIVSTNFELMICSKDVKK